MSSTPQAPPGEAAAHAALSAEAMLMEAAARAPYEWIAPLVEGRRVLDAGCGLGVGGVVLRAAGAAHLTVVDEAPARIEIARTALGGDAEFQIGDLRSLPFPDATFNLVTCLAGLSEGQAAHEVVSELARVLTPDGAIAIAGEATLAEALQTALGGQFAHVFRASLGLVAGVAVLSDSATVLERGLDAQADPQLPVIFLAGDGLVEAPPAVAIELSPRSIEEWRLAIVHERQRHREARMLAREHDLRAQEVTALRRRLEEAEAALAELPSYQRDANLTERERERLQELTAEVERYRLERDQAQAVYRDLQSSLSWRITAPLRRLKRR